MRIAWILLLLAISSLAQVSAPSEQSASNATDASSAGSPFSSSLDNAGGSLLAKGAAPSSVLPIAPGAVSSAAVNPAPVEMAANSNQFVTSKPLEEPSAHNKRIWYSLMAVQHGAAGFDAWSTRQAIQSGGQELNPTLKPFAHSAAIYPALQLWPTAMDYLGHKMMRSNRPLYRRLWWLPQAASTAAFLTFGAHNLTLR
ncbi:MAG TPA: hypothetical protein VK473_11990 [Terriglobales bacterium]|nr:hypothetical protein [Terriglobales bacterium]